MRFHKEGYTSLVISLIFGGFLIAAAHYFFASQTLIQALCYIMALFGVLMIVQFFRDPAFIINKQDAGCLSPADGKVVVIKKVFEPEYFKAERLQISVFMSPLNVHINRNPICGLVNYAKYHPGKYLVAWHPKSSTNNERNSVVIKSDYHGKEILFRQIAGVLARRIVCYLKVGDRAAQGKEMGFIKFGSRVDVFLPLDAQVLVKLQQQVKGGQTILASL